MSKKSVMDNTAFINKVPSFSFGRPAVIRPLPTTKSESAIEVKKSSEILDSGSLKQIVNSIKTNSNQKAR